MATPFVIDDNAAALLAQLKRAAEANPVSKEEMMRQVAANGPPPLLNDDQTVALPFGFTVTFTIEWQPMGMCRHMSMASPSPGRAPIPPAIIMVTKELGFTSPEPARHVWPEHLQDGRIAINVLEVMTPHKEVVN